MNPIETDTLTKRFGRVHALDGLSFSVPQGAVHALVGPNGAGKTTLIKILMNIFRASSGRASILGVDSKKISGKAFASIGYVSENQQLPGWMRVGAFLEYLRPFYPTWDTQLEAQLARIFDLQLDRKLKQLSRGMRHYVPGIPRKIIPRQNKHTVTPPSDTFSGNLLNPDFVLLQGKRPLGLFHSGRFDFGLPRVSCWLWLPFQFPSLAFPFFP